MYFGEPASGVPRGIVFRLSDAFRQNRTTSVGRDDPARPVTMCGFAGKYPYSRCILRDVVDAVPYGLPLRHGFAVPPSLPPLSPSATFPPDRGNRPLSRGGKSGGASMRGAEKGAPLHRALRKHFMNLPEIVRKQNIPRGM